MAFMSNLEVSYINNYVHPVTWAICITSGYFPFDFLFVVVVIFNFINNIIKASLVVDA